MRKFMCFHLLLIGILVLPCLLRAQNAISGGSISGRVADKSGAVVPGVTVTLVSNQTGVEQRAATNSSGLYRFPALAVGSYTLSFSQSGFRPLQVEGVAVQVGQDTAQNVVLELGSLEQSVSVTATAPLLRTTESTASTVVNQQLIEDLPLSGRRYTDFVLLTPNVATDGQFGLVTVGGQQGGADSGYANGNGSNSFTLDGANATSSFFGDARGRTRVPYIFGEQSIQEFQVADNPYSAAYGGAGTGFVNTVTKSGTDAYHGDAFYYNRNSGTGANDAIDKANGVPRPLNVLQQFGADLGGPIAQHKAWFYFDYEQQRQREPISVINAAFSGVTEATFTNVAPGTPLPAPNGPFPSPSTFATAPMPSDPNYAIYLQQVANALHAIQSNLGQRNRRRDDLSFFPKVDWQPTAQDHLSFVYNYNRFNSPGGTITFNPVSFDGVESLPNNFVRDHHATVHYTHTFSGSLLNDLHVSFLRDEQIETPANLVSPTLPSAGILQNGQFFGLGNPTFAVGDTKEFQWEIGERLTWVHGRHSLDFGFDFNRNHVTDFFPGNFLGTYFFLSPTEFALGKWLTFKQSGGNPVFPFTFPYYGFYVQDKFQVRPNLTLDLGLREDFQVFAQPQVNPAFPLTGQFPNQYQRISPRLGFAYQPFSKTVLRGGFGIFHELFNGINYEGAVVSNGLPSRQTSASLFDSPSDMTAPNALSPAFPGVLPNSALTASNNLSFVDPGFQTPYILESSLEIQREILANTTVTLGSLWTHGVHLIASSLVDRNLNLPPGVTTYTVCPPGTITIPCSGPTFTGPNLDSGLLSDGRISSSLGQLNALVSPGTNNYNSFYVKIERRFSRGFSLLTSYTLSKVIQGNGTDFNNQFDFHDTHGPSLLDQRHRLSVAAVYSPNAKSIRNDLARHVLSNWTVSTVTQFNSGRPFTGLLNSAAAGSTLNDSAINESAGSTAAGINGGGPSPGIGFNRFYGPWIDEVDLGISRGFHLTEKNVLTFTAQAFNLVNHPNFFVQNGSGINSTQYDPMGANCGDAATANQTCFLVPDAGFKTLQSIDELNGPRIFQFALAWKF